jgi:hypothetical protein
MITRLREFGALAGVPSPEEFAATCATRVVIKRAEVLARAIDFTLRASECPLEVSFISLYSSLESVLTYTRSEGDFDIIPDRDFQAFEGDLKKWLRKHPLLAEDPVRRSLIYEKTRELNRFPFSQIFRRFSERYSLDISDLWPLIRGGVEWPLMEIRHRLIHGDPFVSRPVEAIVCAREHLRWTAMRMILAVLEWPLESTGLSAEKLATSSAFYTNWREERAKLA